MIDQDLLFRAGLMLAVFVLAGTFGAALADQRESVKEAELDRIGDLIGSILIRVHGSEPGSSVEFHIGQGISKGSDAAPISTGPVPADLRVKVLPGMIILQSCGDEMVIDHLEGIVPAYPPGVSIPFNSSTSSAIAVDAGGYSVCSPCILRIEKPSNSPPGSLFIHPLPPSIRLMDEIVEEICSLFLDEGLTLPGWSREVIIPAEDVISIDVGYMMFRMVDAPVEEGKCPLPVPLPITFDIPDPRDPWPDAYSEVVLYKGSFVEAGGYISIRSYVEYR